MTDVSARIAALSPDKLRVLERLLTARADGVFRAPEMRRREREATGSPLSYSQERLWFIDQMQPGLPIYNMPLAIRTATPLNVRVLERSLNEIVARHESLRTTFSVSNRNPVQ